MKIGFISAFAINCSSDIFSRKVGKIFSILLSVNLAKIGPRMCL